VFILEQPDGLQLKAHLSPVGRWHRRPLRPPALPAPPDDFVMSMDRFKWSEIEACSCLSRAAIESAASVYRNSKAVIVCYGIGLTRQHSGVLSIQMLTNLLPMRGNIGKPGGRYLSRTRPFQCSGSADRRDYRKA
jgi:anaerobic selenocysteine-containing dehydrogenase